MSSPIRINARQLTKQNKIILRAKAYTNHIMTFSVQFQVKMTFLKTTNITSKKFISMIFMHHLKKHINQQAKHTLYILPKAKNISKFHQFTISKESGN